MNMKSLKTQFIGAIAMVLVAAIAMGSSTYAWFALNNKVTVTGMTVRTQVSNNLLIAPLDATTKGSGTTDMPAYSTYRTQYIDHLDALLEPVSTINGKNDSFYYTRTNNVDSLGDAIADTYFAYNPSSTDDFNTNYKTTGAVGYVDYAFAIQATNTDNANSYFVNMTKCDLNYTGVGDGNDTVENAFRIAVLTQDGTNGTTANSTVNNLTLLSNTATTPGNAYYTNGKAVTSTTALGDVAKLATAANIGTVAAGTTSYYKIVVRLWLEGEDESCTSATFAKLADGNWNLDLAFELQNATGGVTNYTKATHAAIDLTGFAADASKNITLKDSAGSDVVYAAYANSDVTYYMNSARWFSITGNEVYEITEYVTNAPTT